jgi:hypothetical protein
MAVERNIDVDDAENNCPMDTNQSRNVEQMNAVSLETLEN